MSGKARRSPKISNLRTFYENTKHWSTHQNGTLKYQIYTDGASKPDQMVTQIDNFAPPFTTGERHLLFRKIKSQKGWSAEESHFNWTPKKRFAFIIDIKFEINSSEWGGAASFSCQ